MELYRGNFGIMEKNGNYNREAQGAGEHPLSGTAETLSAWRVEIEELRVVSWF